MHSRVGLRRCCGLLLLLVCLASPAFAQNASLVDRLPPETLLVFDWHGTGSLAAVSKTNPALRFWADPVCASLRDQLLQKAYANMKPDVSGKKLTFEEFTQFLSLFENHFVAGIIGENFVGASNSKNPHGYFFAFDTTGKQDLVEKLRSMSANGKKPTFDSSVAVGSVRVEKYIQPNETYYQATVDNFYVRSDSIDVMRILIPRFGAGELPANSLVRSASYQEARGLVPVGTLAEFFLRIPDLRKLQVPPNPKFDFLAFADAIHLEKLHAFDISVSFAPDVTRFHGAILGDTSPGSVLDFFGTNGSALVTLPLAPVGTAYTAGKMNLLALYKILRKGLLAGLPPSEATNFAQMDSMASMGLGMPLEDALRLFTGEFAQVHDPLSSDPASALYAVSIRDQEQTLNLLRHALATMLATEDTEGDVTFLEIAVPYSDPKTGTKRRHSYALAVTHSLIIAGPRKSVLRDAIARTSGATSASAQARLMDDPDFVRTRSSLPQNLTGLGYADLVHADWNKIVSGWTQAAEQAAQKSGKPVDPSLEVVKKIAPSLLPNYFHQIYSASWKEPTGFYFDGFVR